MRRKEFMNVNEERLKEIMAHETEDASGRNRERGRQGKGRDGVCIHTRWQDRKADCFP